MAAMPDQQVGVYPTPSTSLATSQVLSPSVPLDMDYYLTEGLEEAAHKEYIDNRSFAGAVKSQTNALKAGNGGQYVVFSPVTEDQLTKIDHLRDIHYKRLRFMYLNHQQVLIVKIMPGAVHEVATSEFGRILWEKSAAMGLHRNLGDMRGTRYQGIASSKEADSAFKPLSRPHKADWPTLVIESGVSEKLPRLRADARWWLENSSGDVNIVLLFSISAAAQTIHLEKWEIMSVPNLQVTRLHPHPFVMTPTQTDQVDIVQPIAAGGALTLDFAKIFLRQPVQGGLEGNIIFTTLDLEEWAHDVWLCVQ